MKSIALSISLLSAILFYSSSELENRSFFDDKVLLSIPSDFIDMPQRYIDRKYPTPQRPSIILMNEDTEINIALDLTSNQANQSYIPEFNKSSAQAYKNAYPDIEWISDGVKEINGRKVGYSEFVVPAIDTKIYNLIFMTDVSGKLLVATFNCAERYKDDWSAKASEVMNSLVVKE